MQTLMVDRNILQHGQLHTPETKPKSSRLNVASFIFWAFNRSKVILKNVPLP
jgi:hypothetical protein